VLVLCNWHQMLYFSWPLCPRLHQDENFWSLLDRPSSWWARAASQNPLWWTSHDSWGSFTRVTKTPWPPSTASGQC